LLDGYSIKLNNIIVKKDHCLGGFFCYPNITTTIRLINIASNIISILS